jgi:hypothetical protein
VPNQSHFINGAVIAADDGVAGAAHRLRHHQGVVVGKEGAPLGRPAGKGQEHVGHEAGLFLHLQYLGLDVVGQLVEVGGGVAVGSTSQKPTPPNPMMTTATTSE